MIQYHFVHHTGFFRCIFFFLILLFEQVHAQQGSVITGKIDSEITGRRIYLRLVQDYGKAPGFAKQNIDSCIIDSTGSFSLHCQLNTAYPVEMSYGRDHIDFFLFPGDSLRIAFQPGKPLSSLHIDGKGAQCNRVLNKIRVAELESRNFKKKFHLLEIEKFCHLSDSIYLMKKGFVESAENLVPDAKQYLMNEVKFEWAAEHLHYVWQKFNTLIQAGDSLPLPKYFYSFEDSIDINHLSNIRSKSFYRYADSYLNSLMPEHFVRYNMRTAALEPVQVKKFKLAAEHLKGKTRDIMLSRILSGAAFDRIDKKHIEWMEFELLKIGVHHE
jgi:hypothetical protein